MRLFHVQLDLLINFIMQWEWIVTISQNSFKENWVNYSIPKKHVNTATTHILKKKKTNTHHLSMDTSIHALWKNRNASKVSLSLCFKHIHLTCLLEKRKGEFQMPWQLSQTPLRSSAFQKAVNSIQAFRSYQITSANCFCLMLYRNRWDWCR